VFAFTNVMHFLANEFAGLRRFRLAAALVATGASQRFFLRHNTSAN